MAGKPDWKPERQEGKPKRTRRMPEGFNQHLRRRVEKVCRRTDCGKKFEVRASAAARGEGSYCSRECWRLAGGSKWSARGRAAVVEKLRDRQGTKNPNYKNGRAAGKRISGWNAAAKGERECRVCGRSTLLSLHHVIPRSKCQAAKRDLRNGLPLCGSCHKLWHSGHPIYREVFRADEWAYISSVTLTGEMIGAWLDKHYPERSPEAADRSPHPIPIEPRMNL